MTSIPLQGRTQVLQTSYPGKGDGPVTTLLYRDALFQGYSVYCGLTTRLISMPTRREVSEECTGLEP